ncbi:MAG: hypothetical protein ACHQFW_10470 [Chitinophagales bacterium]
MAFSKKISVIAFTFLAFIFICLAADYIITNKFTVTSPYSTCNKVNRLFNENHEGEIPVFGSSRVEKGYFCDSLGNNFYNYGMPNASFDVIRLLLEPELQKNKTGPILIDVHHGFFDHDPYENINIETFLPFINTNESIKQFLVENGRFNRYQQIMGIRYFGFYTGYLKPFVEKRFEIDDNFYDNGGVFNTKVSNTASLQKRVSARMSKKLHFTYDKSSDSTLLNLINTNPGRRFVFVLSPYHSSAKQTLDNFDAMINYFSALDKQFDNADFIFLPTDDYSDNLWKDTIHLNIFGAKKFSAELRNELKSKIII